MLLATFLMVSAWTASHASRSGVTLTISQGFGLTDGRRVEIVTCFHNTHSALAGAAEASRGNAAITEVSPARVIIRAPRSSWVRAVRISRISDTYRATGR